MDTESRQQKCQERSSGIRDQDFKEQLHLGSKRASSRIFRKALVLEIMR
jgi:hypothetical protein